MKDQTTSGADWLYDFAAQNLRGGSPTSEIIKRMMRSGVDPVRASEVVRQVEQQLLSKPSTNNSRARYRIATPRWSRPRPTLRSVLVAVIALVFLAAIVRNILVPPTPLPPSYRPVNSIIGREPHLQGDRSLTVNNNTTDDSVIFLVGETGSIAIAYVRAGETFQIIGVPRGDYNFFYTLGSQWNGRTFNHGTQQGKLKKSLDYQVYSEHEVTIYKTVGPRDQSEAVNDGTFPIIPATDPEQP